jgi:diguanylate cyclase (GGDEF)-like protein
MEAEELKGRILGEIVFDQEGTLPDFNERLHTNNLKSIFLKTKTGLKKEITLCATVIKKQNGEKTGTIINMHDPSEPQNDREEIIYLSYHDVLTGLFNRRYFEMRLKLLDAAHYLPLSILMGDVNGLKFTNDVFGHFAGDHLLFIVSEVMKKCCHENHIIARWGGDEFVILMPNTDERTATDIAKKISRECLQYDADKLTVSISFGYATKNTSEKRANDILTRAEDLMYKNKTSESKAFKAAAVEKIENRLFNTCYESLDQIKTLQELSKKISPFFNLSDIEIRELELLARMHDYGEIAINSYLLEKPSKLTKQEWKEVKKHPEIGYRIINTITSHLEVGELILTHHENWNGSGYPSGLSKTNIPILSRIFAVIDGYTAMLNERPYRKALSVESAVDNLKREAGTKYDPQVVEVFLKEIVKI